MTASDRKPGASPPQDLFGEAPAPVPRPAQRRTPTTPPRHTWFFALRPAAEDAARMAAFAERLLASHGVSGKRTGPDRLHITLDLVGHDVDAAVVAAACRAADTLRWPALQAGFDAARTFPAPSGPFVLVGEEGLGAVRGLRQALAMALADQGLRPGRAYEPHMTLCYDPRHRVARTPIEPIGFPAREFALVKSHIGFSRHEVLRTWPLAG